MDERALNRVPRATPPEYRGVAAPVPESRIMRMDKLTSRFQQAIADAQSLAVGRDHNVIEPVHLMVALLDQQGGGTRPLLAQWLELPEACVAPAGR